MTTVDIDALGDLCRRAGRLANGIAGDLYHPDGTPYDPKEDGSPVTRADREVEALLREGLQRLRPGVPVFGEETGGEVVAEGEVWYVDPVDGTRVFMAGIPTWTISVGLLRDGETVLGAVLLAAKGLDGELITGGVDHPLQRGGRPARPISPSSTSQTCALVPSDAHRRYRLRMPGRVRCLGSTALHLALVACGGALGAVLHTSRVWDVAGAMALLRAADVPLAHLDGRPLDLVPYLDGSRFTGPLLAAPAWAFDDVARMIEPLDAGEVHPPLPGTTCKVP